MQDAKQVLTVVRRAIAIANSKEYDEDVVRRMLVSVQDELVDAGLRWEDTGQLSEAA